MSELVPCPCCRRHVRAAETACPFCACALPEHQGTSAASKPRGRMNRAALFAAGAALLGAAACDTSSGPVGMPVYGAPVPDASADTVSDVPIERLPLPDGRTDGNMEEAGGSDDAASDRGQVAIYGAPAPLGK